MELIESLRGTTIVLIEHLMQAVPQLCDRGIFMSFGQKIVEVTPQEALANPEVVPVSGEADAAGDPGANRLLRSAHCHPQNIIAGGTGRNCGRARSE